jgi:hypothetical protein
LSLIDHMLDNIFSQKMPAHVAYTIANLNSQAWCWNKLASLFNLEILMPQKIIILMKHADVMDEFSKLS